MDPAHGEPTMKIHCPCGGLIVDGTDSLPNKAYLLADQDWTGMVGESEAEDASLFELRRQSRAAYQCHACGRLTLDDPVTGEMLWFAPEQPHTRSALGSVRGDAFPADLRGRWRSHANEGDLYWNSSGDLPGGFEKFNDQAALAKRYHAVLEMLMAQGRLQSAVLDDADGVKHEWLRQP